MKTNKIPLNVKINKIPLNLKSVVYCKKTIIINREDAWANREFIEGRYYEIDESESPYEKLGSSVFVYEEKYKKIGLKFEYKGQRFSKGMRKVGELYPFDKYFNCITIKDIRRIKLKKIYEM